MPIMKITAVLWRHLYIVRSLLVFASCVLFSVITTNIIYSACSGKKLMKRTVLSRSPKRNVSTRFIMFFSHRCVPFVHVFSHRCVPFVHVFLIDVCHICMYMFFFPWMCAIVYILFPSMTRRLELLHAMGSHNNNIESVKSF